MSNWFKCDLVDVPVADIDRDRLLDAIMYKLGIELHGSYEGSILRYRIVDTRLSGDKRPGWSRED